MKLPTGFVVRTLTAIALIGLSTRASAQNMSPEGHWRTIDDNTHQTKSIVAIRIVNGEAEGAVEKVFVPPAKEEAPHCDGCPGEFAGKPIVGMRIMWGLKKSGDEWTEGRVFDPDAKKTYRCKVRVVDAGRKLEVRGFIGFSLIGRTQTWVRE